MSAPLLYCNGIDIETGDYLYPPATSGQIAALARGDSISNENRVDMEFWLRQGKRGLRSGDPRDLVQAGWGVIFAQNDPQAGAIQDALRDLLDLRKSQIGEDFEHRYQEYSGELGFQSGDSKRRFLSRHGVGPGAADPDKMPYYLLIIGDPEMIPWEFQYELDMQYAVGRLWFETVDEYRRYAQNVVASEKSPRARAKSAAVFAPEHGEDPPTALSREYLAAPLADRIEKAGKGWSVHRALAADATKANLQKILDGSAPPDLLFTAGHGVYYPGNDTDNQHALMGSLVCQDWPGHGCGRGPRADEFFSAEDVNGADLGGLVSFHFACYSAGVPAIGDFHITRMRTAQASFVSRLPRRLLQAGALAVIGHVDSGYQCSIDFPEAGKHIEVFEDFIDRLLFKGHPVGSAMEHFGVRYADLSRDLGVELEEEKRGEPADDAVLADLWIHSRDARNYVVLGDPAVRLVPPEGEP
jgi:Peptidase family C25